MDATVVKVGGSLALHPQNLKNLCIKLNDVSKTHRLIVVPGGGEFADKVRDFDRRFHLSDSASHQMAILAMDQYGYVLSNLIPNSAIVNKIENIQKTLDSGKIAVFLPSTFFFDADPLPNSWNVTSDSIAVYIARQLGVCRVVLVTDVDGVFTCDPKKHLDAKLIERISAEELLKRKERTSVDLFLPRLLLQSHMECFVVNGLYAERVEDVLENRRTVCTLIT